MRLYPVEVEGKVLLRVGIAVSSEALLEIRRGKGGRFEGLSRFIPLDRVLQQLQQVLGRDLSNKHRKKGENKKK